MVIGPHERLEFSQLYEPFYFFHLIVLNGMIWFTLTALINLISFRNRELFKKGLKKIEKEREKSRKKSQSARTVCH